MAEEVYTSTQEEKDKLEYFKKNHSDEYEMYCNLLKYVSKEQLALMLVEQMEENNTFERMIKRALNK
jgi:hypothetical protein